MSDTLEKVDESLDLNQLVETYEDDDNADHLTHIVNPPNNLHIFQVGMTSADIVSVARLRGIPVKALCGYIFIPKRNPDKYPACDTCIQIAGELMRAGGE